MPTTRTLPGLLFISMSLVPAHATPKLHALFSENAVIQRDALVPVWGTAEKGEEITVEFGGQTKRTTANHDGQWRIVLDPMPANGNGQSLRVEGHKSPVPLEAKNILVGDVWLCSGQSNMERRLGLHGGQLPLENWEAEAASANYPAIRQFLVHGGIGPSDTPVRDINAQWTPCTPQSVPNFTAVGYFFGRDLHKHLEVPIGLINSTVGGTPSEAWTSREALEKECPEVLADHEKAILNHPAALARFAQEEKELLAKWEESAEQARKKGKPEPVRPAAPGDPRTLPARPAALFNGKIHPLIPCAIKGVIWYQGESNNGRARQYRTLFPALIADWRSRWLQPEMPFLFVQIAPFKGIAPDLREAQLLTWQTTPRTAMVVTTDVGDEDDVHPVRKEPVGRRLALAARAIAYGEDIVYSGPVFAEMTPAADHALLRFDHAGGGLVAKDGPLRGFTISGDGQTFASATAEIVGPDTIKVHAESVANPIAVRYGWANSPDVNLFNSANLPATPFRTDRDP